MSSLMMQDTPQLQRYREIRAQIEALEEQAAGIAREVRKGAIEQARALIREFDLTAEELQLAPKAARKAGGGSSAGSASQVLPKYRDPETGATWAGRGAEPAWLRGKNRDDYLIDKPTADKQATVPDMPGATQPDQAQGHALTAQAGVWPFPNDRPALPAQAGNAA